MPTPFMPVQVSAGTPPRGGGTQAALTFAAQSARATFAWGSSPGTATVVYIGDAPVTRGAQLYLEIGGMFFAGLCKSDTVVKGSGGSTRTLSFVDFREYLQWDWTLCAFNKPYTVTVNGVRYRKFWHVYPANATNLIKTFTDGPLQAWEILAAILNYRWTVGGTIGSPWTWDLTGNGLFSNGVLGNAGAPLPLYDFDCLSGSGRRLDAALNEICERTGTVFTLASTLQNPYHLVFTRKGYGSVTFPDNSDNRRLGESLSGNPTNLRLLGERNRYQVMDLAMVPDWARAWEAFLVAEELAEDIFQRGTNPRTNTRYNAYGASDPEFYIGRQDAMVRAKEITVREYVALRNASAGDGNQFADYKKFAGRSRMDMPAALYIQTLLLRAFRPDMTGLFNYNGATIPLLSVTILNEQLCKVTYNPATGAMAATPSEPAEGNGVAIVQGYQVGEDLFRLIQSDQMDLAVFSAAQATWSAVPFQVDEGGEGSQFIIFDAPVFVCDNLFTKVNGHAVLNANWTLGIPPVRAALVFEAERFSAWYYQTGVANVSRDHVESIPSLRAEFVKIGASFTEISYADGGYVYPKALQLANWILQRQFVYFDGGYRLIWDPALPKAAFTASLSSLVDRVEIVSSATEGTYATVDFTTERQRDNFEPERELDRRTLTNSLFPGQAQLREEADAHRKLSASFRQLSEAGLLDQFNKLVTGRSAADRAHTRVWFKNPPSAVMLAGTPMRGRGTLAGTPNTQTLPTYPGSVTSADSLFVGITVRQNEVSTKPFYVAQTGIVPARVMGPVEVNDVVGLTDGEDAASDWLVAGGTPAVGRAREKITTATVKLIGVQLGGGGGCAGEIEMVDCETGIVYLVCGREKPEEEP